MAAFKARRSLACEARNAALIKTCRRRDAACGARDAA